MQWTKFTAVALAGLTIALLSACQPVMPEAQLTAVAQGVAVTVTPPATEEPVPEVIPIPTEESATEPAPAEITALSPYTSVAGIRLLVPPGWAARENEAGVLMLASNPDTLADNSLAVPGAIFVVVNSRIEELGNLTPTALLEGWIAGLPIATKYVSGPEPAVVNGHEGVRAVATGESEGMPFMLIAAAFTDADRVALAASIFPQDQESELRATVEAMLESIEISAPVAAQIDLSVLDGDMNPGQIVGGQVVAGRPSLWRFSGKGGEAFLVSVAPLSGLDVTLDVLDDSGVSILEYGLADSEGGGASERRLATLPGDGNYYVAVRGYTDSEGSFELRVTPTKTVAGVTAEDLAGIWGRQSILIRFDPDGTYTVALSAETLDTAPVLQGPYRVEDGALILGAEEGSAVCTEGEGSYQPLLLEGGELLLRRADDPCLARSRGLSGLVLPPAQS